MESSRWFLSESTINITVSSFQRLQIWLSVTTLTSPWLTACDHSDHLEEPLLSSILKLSLWLLKSSWACTAPSRGVIWRGFLCHWDPQSCLACSAWLPPWRALTEYGARRHRSGAARTTALQGCVSVGKKGWPIKGGLLIWEAKKGQAFLWVWNTQHCESG